MSMGRSARVKARAWAASCRVSPGAWKSVIACIARILSLGTGGAVCLLSSAMAGEGAHPWRSGWYTAGIPQYNQQGSSACHAGDRHGVLDIFLYYHAYLIRSW